MNATITQLGLVEDDAIQLDAAALELAALDHPGLDLGDYVDVLTGMTQRLAASDAATALDQGAALAAIIAEHEGFTGDREQYDDAANADMIRVIDRRRGLPVSLSILYVAAARRVGWSADALNTPGHVLVRIGPATAPALIDPFDDGRPVSPDRLISLFAQMLGGPATPSPHHLVPMTNRETLVRLLSNQATRAEAAGDIARALVVFDRMTQVAPSYGHAWWERARLSLHQGDVATARANLGAMLETTRDARTRARISDALNALAGAG
jgi:regulator of sirC expression with transglutaminase-like and TPR domain